MTVAPRGRFLIHGLAAWAVHLLTPDLAGQIEFISTSFASTVRTQRFRGRGRPGNSGRTCQAASRTPRISVAQLNATFRAQLAFAGRVKNVAGEARERPRS